jgi:hypothetical protein
MEIITYVTHPSGTYELLINNPYDVQVKTIGWGEKWKGYIRKAHCVREYIETLDDNEVVAVIDGWDVECIRNTSQMERDFINMNCGVLISLDPEKNGKWATRRVFGTFRGEGEYVANAGLYVGYVKYIKIMLDAIFKENTPDDQRAMNSVAVKFPWMKIDIQCEILTSSKVTDTAYFHHKPLVFNFERTYRAIGDYAPFFIPEIILILLVLYFLYLHYIKR